MAFFHNFETVRLAIPDPTLNNGLIFLLFFLLAMVSLQRRPVEFLDRNQTDQVKGIAILLVISGHLWHHVSLKEAVPNYAGYAVSLFLFLSGYGLARSWQKLPLTAGAFLQKRASRVMLPYWISTIGFLLLDYWLLDRQYSLQQVAETLAGFNFDPVLRKLDYVRWYITLILVCYAAFFLAYRFLEERIAVVSLFCFSLLLFYLRRKEWFPFGSLYHFAAFPLGCFVACYYEMIHRALRNHPRLLAVAGLLFLLGAVGCFRLVPLLVADSVPVKIMRIAGENTGPLLLCAVPVCLTGILGEYQLVSRFFVLCGILSYELYLIHGPLLIKYNPIFTAASSRFIVGYYFLFLVFLFLVAWLFRWLHGALYRFVVAGLQRVRMV